MKKICLIVVASAVFPSACQGQLEKIHKSLWCHLLKIDEVQQELDFTDTQRDQLNDVLKQIKADWRERRESYLALARQSMKTGDLTEVEKARQEITVAWENSLVSAAEEILLPHQKNRLAQLSIWHSIAKESGYYALVVTIQEELEIDDEQKDDLRAKREQLQEEFESELAELRHKYQEKFNSELTPDQRRKAKEMFGKSPPHIGQVIRF